MEDGGWEKQEVHLWDDVDREGKHKRVHSTPGCKKKKTELKQNQKYLELKGEKKRWRDYPRVIQSVYPIQEICL